MSARETPMSEEPGGPDMISDWENEDPRLEAGSGDTLVVDVEGFEGPLDLLLALARTQKVDLAKISVLALAQQYLDFIAEARRLRLEIAADYLVMAAWLAFLKSKLLLPAEKDEEGEPTGAELAALLAPRGHRGLAALDHEEARTGLALADDGAAGVEGAVLERARDSLELAAVELREERDLLQKLEGWSGHARILMGRGRTGVI